MSLVEDAVRHRSNRLVSSFVPESAPFNEEQRAWLNGFLAGLMGVADRHEIAQMSSAAIPDTMDETSAALVNEDEDLDDAPWHDSSLPLDERMALAEGQPLHHKLMAAMAQLDCGSCGYLCKTYSGAIASREEKNLTLCSPGGKETKLMLKKLVSETEETTPSGVPMVSKLPANGTPKTTRQNPYAATLLESRTLNKEGSSKDTRHIAIDLGGSGLRYRVGDALGVYPTNCRDLVASILKSLSIDPQVRVNTPQGVMKSMYDALLEDYCLKDPSDELLELLIARVSKQSQRDGLTKLLSDGVPDGVDLLDVTEIARGASLCATELVETLGPLNPRLYSIASSMLQVGTEVHLTVGKVFYDRAGRLRKGVASSMLAERLSPGQKLRVFVQPSHNGFTVPANPSAPMIMIGPGTGIAPFRAFLQEREKTSAPGKNWLFFGDQHEAFDFLYEEELKQWQADGVLSQIHTAFSRDGLEKVYVQDRMLENGAELWQWIDSGAHLYVCGDASRMAADVDRALHQIVAAHSSMTSEQSADFIRQLAKNNRYVRDIY